MSIVSDAISSQRSSDPLPPDEPSEVETDTASGDGEPRGDEETAPELEVEPEQLSLDRVFEILKNERRRETLHYLRENDGACSLSDLAEHIAALENDTTVAGLTSKQRKRVYVGLYQCHLPKMDDTEVVDFDQNRGTVRLADNADQLYPYLAKPETQSWHNLYGAIAVVGGLLFVAILQLNVASRLSMTLLLGGLIVSIGGFAIADGYLNGS